MNPDGTGRLQLTNDFNEDGSPAWSPNGKKILFSRDNDLCIMNTNGTNTVNLTNTPSIAEFEGAWSPDGRKIVFVRVNTDTNNHIWVMNADGTGQTQILGDHNNGVPNWQSVPNTQNVKLPLNSTVDLTIPLISSPGTAAAAQLNPKVLPDLPAGYFPASPAFDIRSTINFNQAVVTFKIPAVAGSAVCEQMRVMHFAGGDWFESNNSSPSFNAGVCTVSQIVTMLSPFIVGRFTSGAETTGLSGAVFYGNTPAGQRTRTVSNVTLTATGASFASEDPNSNGSYLLNNLIAGEQYVVTASKIGEANGITSLDATLVLRHVASGGGSLTTNQRRAADANNSHTVTALDATAILRYVASGSAANANFLEAGRWSFLPEARISQSLSDPLFDQNYEAILIGDVTGSWMPSAGSN